MYALDFKRPARGKKISCYTFITVIIAAAFKALLHTLDMREWGSWYYWRLRIFDGSVKMWVYAIR